LGLGFKAVDPEFELQSEREREREREREIWREAGVYYLCIYIYEGLGVKTTRMLSIRRERKARRCTAVQVLKWTGLIQIFLQKINKNTDNGGQMENVCDRASPFVE
jgi:hypothetical protein